MKEIFISKPEMLMQQLLSRTTFDSYGNINIYPDVMEEAEILGTVLDKHKVYYTKNTLVVDDFLFWHFHFNLEGFKDSCPPIYEMMKSFIDFCENHKEMLEPNGKIYQNKEKFIAKVTNLMGSANENYLKYTTPFWSDYGSYLNNVTMSIFIAFNERGLGRRIEYVFDNDDINHYIEFSNDDVKIYVVIKTFGFHDKVEFEFLLIGDEYVVRDFHRVISSTIDQIIDESHRDSIVA